jgi:hypothetical protein
MDSDSVGITGTGSSTLSILNQDQGKSGNETCTVLGSNLQA